VTLGGSNTPVRRAQLNLGGGGRGGRMTTTDDQGRFAFVGLPAGRFTLNVSKPGYATIAYGAKKPGQQGTPIQLAEGQILTNVNIALPKGGVITGVVVDEFGEPSANTPVRAFRYVMQNGNRALQSAGQSQTDDRGIYRIFQLLPGDYVVSAVPRNNGPIVFTTQIQPLLDQMQAGGALNVTIGAAGFAGVLADGRGQQILDRMQQLAGQQPEQPTGYAPVYFPGTITPSQAAKIPLDAGEERTGVDFQLQLVPTAKVQGHITGGEMTTAGVQVMLQLAHQQDTADVPGLGTSMARVNADGSFTFQNVTPGDYRVIARAPVMAVAEPDAGAPPDVAGRGGRGRGRGGPFAGIAQMLWASTDVAVAGHDVSDVTLNLQPGMTIAGRLAFDSATTQPPDVTTARVNLVPSDPQGMMGPLPAAQVDTAGGFTLPGVVPGRYSLRVGVGGPGRGGAGFVGQFGGAAAPVQNSVSWSMKSALLNGRDVLDFPLDIEPNENLSGMLVTLTDRVQEITGTVQDALGRPTSDYTIILFPADNRYWVPQSRRILSTRPSTDGTFTLRGFPAGQYRLAAVTDAAPGEWFDPAFLTQIVPASMTVSLADGEKKTQDLRLAQ
jgi:hypothetical protein